MGGDSARGDLLLGDDRNPGRRARERGEDDQLGGAVGLGDRRGVGFPFDLEAAADNLEDRLARLARSLANLIEQALAHLRQRGAIRMPPSRRTYSALR